MHFMKLYKNLNLRTSFVSEYFNLVIRKSAIILGIFPKYNGTYNTSVQFIIYNYWCEVLNINKTYLKIYSYNLKIIKL